MSQSGREDRESNVGERSSSSVFYSRVWFLTLSVSLAIIAWGVHQITTQIEAISKDHGNFVIAFNAYVVSMEHRVTALEDYQKSQDMRRDISDERLNNLENPRGVTSPQRRR